MSIFSKKAVLIFSIVANLVLFAFVNNILVGLCDEYHGNCQSAYEAFAVVMWWAPFLLLFSLVTYGLDQKIYDTWIRFTIPWLLLASGATFLGSDPKSLYDTGTKGWISLSLTAIFVIVSALIIYFKSRKK